MSQVESLETYLETGNWAQVPFPTCFVDWPPSLPPTPPLPASVCPSALRELFHLPHGAAMGISQNNTWQHVGRCLVNSCFLPAPSPFFTCEGSNYLPMLMHVLIPLPTQFLSAEVEVSGPCLPPHSTQAFSVAGEGMAGGERGRQWFGAQGECLGACPPLLTRCSRQHAN